MKRQCIRFCASKYGDTCQKGNEITGKMFSMRRQRYSLRRLRTHAQHMQEKIKYWFIFGTGQAVLIYTLYLSSAAKRLGLWFCMFRGRPFAFLTMFDHVSINFGKPGTISVLLDNLENFSNLPQYFQIFLIFFLISYTFLESQEQF